MNFATDLQGFPVVFFGEGRLSLVVEHAGESLPLEVRWLLVGALSVALASIALLMRMIKIPKEHQQIYRRGSTATLFSAVLVASLGLLDFTIIILLIVMSLLMFAPVLYGLNVWIKTLGAKEIPIS